MGKSTPSNLVQLSTRVKPSTAEKVFKTSAKMDQPASVWLRMAIMEKLARDGG